MCEYSDQSHTCLQQQGHRKQYKCRGSLLFTVQFQSHFSVPKLLIYFIWIFFYVFEAKTLFHSFFYCKENLKLSVYKDKIVKGWVLDNPQISLQKAFSSILRSTLQFFVYFPCIFIVLCYSVYTGCLHCQLLYFSCSSCCPPIAVWITYVEFLLNRKKCSYLTSLLSYPDNVQNFFFLEQDGYCYLLLQHYSM